MIKLLNSNGYGLETIKSTLTDRYLREFKSLLPTQDERIPKINVRQIDKITYIPFNTDILKKISSYNCVLEKVISIENNQTNTLSKNISLIDNRAVK